MRNWLVLISSLPSENTSLRTKLWRLFKAIGAHPLRDGVYLLPDLDSCRSSFDSIQHEITQAGGNAWVVETQPSNEAQFPVFFDRSADYASLLEHLIQARRLGASSPTDAERVIKRLQKELDQIALIDYFKEAAHAQAVLAMEQFAKDLRLLHSPNEPHFATGTIKQLSVKDFQFKKWATRKNMWIDRMACAWLIKRFIDTGPTFLWLGHPSECPEDALGFDFDGAQFTHIDSKVSFEVLIAAFDLHIDGLTRLANVIHFLDAGGIPVPEAPGVERMLAGLRSQAPDDDQLLAMVTPVFDALLIAFQNDNEQSQP